MGMTSLKRHLESAKCYARVPNLFCEWSTYIIAKVDRLMGIKTGHKKDQTVLVGQKIH